MSEKQSKLESLQEKMMIVTSKVQGNTYVQAVTQGMMGSMGVLIGGSIVNLLVNLPIPGLTELLQTIGIYDLLTVVVKVFQLTSPLMAFLIGRSLAELKGANGLQAGVISFMCFLLSVPLSLTDGGADAVEISYLNGQNIMSAIIIGLLASSLFCVMSKTKLKIKMPDSVPPFVSQSFESMPAGLVTVLPFIVLRGLLAASSFGSLPGLVTALLVTPLTKLGNTLGGHMVFLFFSSLLWWLGIHNMPIWVVVSIVCSPALTENINAVMSGQTAPNMLSMLTYMIPAQLIGGPGATLGLAVAVALFAKSERLKAQSKIQLVPALFNITEPAFFGMPTILNPMFFIPMQLAPWVIELLMYFGLKLGLFKTPISNVSMFLPAPITGFLMGGGIGLGIFIILACVIAVVIYTPFVVAYDKQLQKEEAAYSAEN